SRSQWQKLIKDGRVFVNAESTPDSSYELGEDDEVTVKAPKPPVLTGDIEVLYEDKDVLVMNKPSGTLSHAKGFTPEEFTVADFVRRHMTEADDGSMRPGIVHRLDRDTSGIIIAAKHEAAKSHLQRQFQDRKAKKTYIAVVSGTPKETTAKIDLPLSRNPKRPSSFRVDPKGKASQTFYEVIDSNATMSVLELKPITGRTHQLRVHLAYIGTPIVGDAVYNGLKSPIGRLCLHAQALEITLPSSERMTFTAPIPDDMEGLIARVRS
ncbi:MAG: RluA family pseudouridine synthase, partial [Candidatus Saccharimonadales bacterium]